MLAYSLTYPTQHLSEPLRALEFIEQRPLHSASCGVLSAVGANAPNNALRQNEGLAQLTEDAIGGVCGSVSPLIGLAALAQSKTARTLLVRLSLCQAYEHSDD